ncbi:MAG: 4-hydroxybutyrate--acetyl-CoA CoA transferase [Defluviitaleaceae bacterium]|nr:4-hydroxybutyrate--acetyl-CoA CoA transferase [Defluviitaleaceae bacterium]MCL2239597.1 4-hydroxybutyrate--acetyl-CoA CoA transferase [Defluviitaleaceae bacterium]
MPECKALYDLKKKSIPEALQLIKSGDAVMVALGAAEPVALLAQAHTIAENGVRGVDITNCLPMGNYEFITVPNPEVITNSGWFYGAAQRKAAKEGQPHVSHVPQRLHNAGIRRYQAMRGDGRRVVLLVSCSPMDAHGYLSLSLSATYERQLINEGVFVIAEVNTQMPRTFGETLVHISEIGALVESDRPVPELPHVPFNANDEKIANFIAERVEDGSTIQLGIGGIPNALANGLKNKKHLGIHTEMLTDNMVDLVRCGAVDNSMKTLMKHKTVGTFAMGTRKLYDFVNNNPSVVLNMGCWVNDPAVIGQNYKMQSINTAIEVDLFGQCASESIGPVQYSGSGGQADTAIGAQRSAGGHSFICLYSTATIKNKDGEKEVVSKITPMLKHGSVVTLSRNDVDYVVTEYGIVSLRGRSLKERATRLISIAHPDFKDELNFHVKKHPEIY